MKKKWIINSKKYFPYSAQDIYLNWWITSRKPSVTQSVVEFLNNPIFNIKELLAAERKFLKLDKVIKKQISKDVTEYFKDSVGKSAIFRAAISKGERIYAIKVPFHVKKWKTKNGRAIWEDVVFSDNTTARLQVIDKNPLNIILSIICTRSISSDGEVIDTRFIGSDEIMISGHQKNVYGIKISEMREVLKSYNIDNGSESSVFLFSENPKKIKKIVDIFIDQFNVISKRGLAGLAIKEQRIFDSIAGKTVDVKIKNIIQELSISSHPYFPESVFATAFKNGLGNAVIEVVGIDSGWEKTHYLKKVLNEWLFTALFWTSSNWIKLFFKYSKTPKIYHKLFGGDSFQYRGGDIDWTVNYIECFSKNKKIALIDFGIGTGRELRFLKENKQIKKIIGIDYSEFMLDFCRKKWEGFSIPLILISDDFIALKKSQKAVKNISIPKVFTIFFGTINNIIKEDRSKMLIAVKKLMSKNDIFIIEFSKRPEDQIIDFKHSWLKFRNRVEEVGFYEAGVYAQLQWFWEACIKNFGTVPQFFYEKKTNNIVVTAIGVGSCFFSHRFSVEEIRELIETSGLKLEELREGREMYTAIIKK